MSLQSLEIQPIGRALVARRADQALDVGLHQDLQHGLGHGAQKVALTGLLHELGQCHPLLGHRDRPRSWVKPCISTLADRPDDRLATRRRTSPDPWMVARRAALH